MTLPPTERDARRVLRDYRDDQITLEEAAEIHGVVIDPDIRTVRENETERKRASLGAPTAA